MSAALASAVADNPRAQAAWEVVKYRLNIAPDETQPRAAVVNQLRAQLDDMSLAELQAAQVILAALPEDPIILPRAGFEEMFGQLCPRKIHFALAMARQRVADEREAQRLRKDFAFLPADAAITVAGEMANISAISRFYGVKYAVLHRVALRGPMLAVRVELLAFGLREATRAHLTAKERKLLVRNIGRRAMLDFLRYDRPAEARALGLISERVERETIRRLRREVETSRGPHPAPEPVPDGETRRELRKVLNSTSTPGRRPATRRRAKLTTSSPLSSGFGRATPKNGGLRNG